MIGASPSSGLVAIQCARALVRDAASIRGQWANCSQLDAMLHHAGNQTTVNYAKSLSFGSPALHHVHTDHVCTMVQVQSTKSLARRHGANGHRDAYLVRCGHFERPPPPSSASAFSQDQGQHGVRQDIGRMGASSGNSTSNSNTMTRSRTGKKKAAQDDDNDRRREARTPNNGEGPAAAGKKQACRFWY
ncbi:hypothetical protein V8C26DRAFT_386624 [Trichoderma gracile]